jgi:hypothetical protein
MEKTYTGHKFEMNDEKAQFIKELRVKEDCSWRGIHAEYQKKYYHKDEYWYNAALVEMFGKDPDEPHGNQIDGMYLCDSAMNYLGEDVEDGWN